LNKGISDDSIKKVVKILLDEKKKPTPLAISLALKVSPEILLSYLAEKAFPEFGIVAGRISEERVKRAVEELKLEGKELTKENVSKKLGVKRRHLVEWSRRKKIPLKRFGIIEKKEKISEFLIKAAIEKLKEKVDGKKITQRALAKEIEVPQSTFWLFLKRKKLNLKDGELLKNDERKSVREEIDFAKQMLILSPRFALDILFQMAHLPNLTPQEDSEIKELIEKAKEKLKKEFRP